MASIAQLEYALAVERHLHFAKAAKACHVTQPTLSMQLQKLEDEIGASIFDRSKKPIKVTDIGQMILHQARVVLHEYRQLNHIVANTNNELRGDFTLAVIPTLSPYLLPLFISTFARRYPQVNIQIQEQQTEQIIAAFEQESIDAGLLVTPLRDKQISELALFYEPFLLYAQRKHELMRQPNHKLAERELKSQDVWLLDEGHCFRNQVISVCGYRQGRTNIPNLRFAGGSIETLKRLVDSGGGYTLVPYLAKDTLSKHSATREFARPIPAREISIVFRRRALKSAIIEALAETILSCLPEELRKIRKKDLEVVAIT